MVHESGPTYYAFGSHPRRVFSISYLLTGFFHGGNTDSNPVGANTIQENPSLLAHRIVDGKELPKQGTPEVW